MVRSESAPTPEGRRAFLLVTTAIVATGVGQTMVFAVLAPLGREIGLSEIQVGTIISASSIAFFVCSNFWGRLSDDWGRRRVMLIGLLGYTVGTLLFASSFEAAALGLLTPMGAFAALTAARVAQSCVMSATPPAASALIADITTVADRTRGMGSIGAAQNVGAIAGPALGGLLAVISLLTPIWVAAAGTLVAAGLVWMFLPDPPRQPRRADAPRLSFVDRRILPFVIVGVVMFLGFSIVQQTLAFRLQDAFQLSGAETARTYGFAMMLSAIASLVAQVGIVNRMNLAPSTLLRLAMPLLLAALSVIAMVTDEAALFGAMALLGLGMGLASPAFTSGASLAVGAEEQGALAGVTSSCPPLGFTIGPLLGTALYQIDGRLPYVVALALYVPLALFVFLARPGAVGSEAPRPAR